MEINRVKVIESVVFMMLENAPDELRQDGYIHLFGTEFAAALIAKKRGLDPQLAAVCGLLHDYAKYQTGEDEDHARKSADLSMPILAKTELFTPCETATVAAAIAAHSDKESVGQPYEEMLKDADVLAHHYMRDQGTVDRKYPRASKRFAKLAEEFSL